MNPITRRKFVHHTATATIFASTGCLAANSHKTRHPICVFTKPFQSLSYDDLADRIAELGFDGIEAPIRDGGHIEPEQVPDELPKMVEALRKRKLEITVMTSSINDANHPLTEKILRTAAKLGIKRYRMKYYKYDLNKPVLKQLDEWRPKFRDLAAMNKDIGISAIYQNHAGRNYLGAAIWDLKRLLNDIPVDQIGVAYDIRHATVEASQSWPVTFNMIRPHIGTVYVKDFDFVDGKVKNVPLGKGRIDPKFFQLLAKSDYTGPISLHEEYINHRDPKLVPQHLAAIKQDFKTLKKWLR